MLSFGHLVGDMYYATLIPLWPLLIDRMALTLTDVGFFTSLTSFMLMPVQPFIGWLVDRFPRAWFMILGLIGAALGMSFIGLAPTYTLLMVCVVFGRFSNSIFHPPRGHDGAGDLRRAARHGYVHFRVCRQHRHCSRAASERRRRHPIRVGVHLSVGTGSDCWPLLRSIASSAWTFLKNRRCPIRKREAGVDYLTVPRRLLGPLIFLAVLMTFRAAILGGFTTFLPIFLVENRAVSLLMGGFGLSALSLFGALGGLVGGHLYDRYSGSWVIAISLSGFRGGNLCFCQDRRHAQFVLSNRGLACLCLQANRLPSCWPRVSRQTGWRWHQG